MKCSGHRRKNCDRLRQLQSSQDILFSLSYGNRWKCRLHHILQHLQEYSVFPEVKVRWNNVSTSFYFPVGSDSYSCKTTGVPFCYNFLCRYFVSKPSSIYSQTNKNSNSYVFLYRKLFKTFCTIRSKDFRAEIIFS